MCLLYVTVVVLLLPPSPIPDCNVNSVSAHTPKIVFVTGEYQELNEKSSLQEGVIKLLLREGVKTLKPWVTFFLSI